MRPWKDVLLRFGFQPGEADSAVYFAQCLLNAIMEEAGWKRYSYRRQNKSSKEAKR